MQMLVEALNRYIAAKGYIEAVKMIWLSEHNQSQEHKVMTILPMHMLGAFALELFFKAWLLHAGKSSVEVKGYGHDLSKLHTDAKLAGLPDIPALDDVVHIFADPHKDFSYRYLESDITLTIANWPNVFMVVDHLDAAVDCYVGASASKGLQPGH